MKRILKHLLGWDRRPPLDRSILVHRVLHALAIPSAFLFLPLPWLLRIAGTDKHRSDGHLYGPAYAAVLRRFRLRPIHLLEIGIGGTDDDIGGRSLLAWRACFPFGRLTACDIRDRAPLAAWRTRILRLDQGSAGDLAALAATGPYDVIIDDGSHLGAHQIMTFEALFPVLRDGGIYVIEDVQTSYWEREIGGVRWDGADPRSPDFARTCMGRALELAKHLNHAEFPDASMADPSFLALARQVRRITFEHNLIIVVKGPNVAPSNTIGAGCPVP